MSQPVLPQPLPQIIQGGMGVAISDWRLARAVATAGQLGIVSGTGIDSLLTRRLQDGDPDGSTRRALSHFPNPELAQRALDTYFLEGGRAEGQPYKRVPLPSVGRLNPAWELAIVGGFVETWLAKEGHSGQVGMNLLTKLQMHTIPPLLGAMLAGVDFVIMGAGIPRDIPAVLDNFAIGQAATIKLDVKGEPTDHSTRLTLDPAEYGLDLDSLGLSSLKRPNFLPIITSHVLAQTLARKASGSVEGFVIEAPTAGGHNAPPRGKMQLDDLGQPIYSERDLADLEQMRDLGLPFWLAGGSGSPEGLQHALSEGAAGIQVGTLFAYCTDSGMDDGLRREALTQIRAGAGLRTDPLASPTGFPFKVVQLSHTLANAQLYAERTRICDIGYLREAYWEEVKDGKEGKIGLRCASEPIETYVRKGGSLEATVGRKCLCNGLMADAGFPQIQKGGEIELPLLTSGDDVVKLAHWQDRFSAGEVIRYLLGQWQPASDGVVAGQATGESDPAQVPSMAGHL
ncbi:putative 2-nitropropane dioxygenase [Deinococcus proteolyticus MRP]|uniref:Putative 2-nitropropane dioxygenase n=1 Tax=Deinococcus proteolyticus (strain ATCC 35074 / DSM 20540 / JCM 6276 / NBRC 101906 / NCIMB 13154 / VKM Ac-1939 / CCM 2703 / MRP) TaxID=693977 RepID=F0RKV3_DEIPM|nr:nitronate monooxygenase [Deinococcus proteolyticus]ADY26815.1 putative 2-nitropropane dioxygenase [Deinococcus proteolyticus MRP]